MKTIRNFPTIFVKAVSSPSFYQDVIKGKTTGAFGYFLLLTLLLALVKTLLASATLIPLANIFINKLQENIVDVFPSDLEIKIENGSVKSNMPQPYKIPFTHLQKLLPQATTDLSPQIVFEENFLVIDEKAKTEDILKYNTLLLLTNSGIVIKEQSDAGFRYQPFSKDTNLTIDRRTVRVIWSRISPMAKWITPGIVSAVAVIMLLYYPLWHLIYLVFGSLLLLLYMRMAKLKISFKTLYRVGLYSITLPLLINYVVSIFLPTLWLPFSFTLIFLLFSQYMLRNPSP
ncbi:MAG: hypothetical protein UW73_C0023G0007 [Microgenomates group bacterium GW2011_GWB1_44_8]|nr:MAG: hypothetical protein UW73_C0023G0007 [Microgenomates group bacterium GW2011_GWB1_44_8]